MKQTKPPRTAEFLLSFLIPAHIGPSGIGDYEEIYNLILQEEGKFRAVFWYWSQLFFAIPASIKESVTWSFIMFRNYFVVTLRNLKKRKFYSFANISGLAIGLACGFMILLYVLDELSYDRFHENADRIYRIRASGALAGKAFDMPLSPGPMAEALLNDYPEIENAVRILGSYSDALVNYEDKTFTERRFMFADSSLFDIFTFELFEGNPATALNRPNTVVLSESSALKYFGNENPLGKTIRYENRLDLEVTGVMRDIPHNSHIHFDFIGSLNTLEISKNQIWVSHNFYTFLRLQDGFLPEMFEEKIPEFLTKYVGPQLSQMFGVENPDFTEGEGMLQYRLQPLTSIHLHSNLDYEIEPNGDIRYVYSFMIIAIFIILIACFNFMNLATARSTKRAKEVGIRKTLGSNRFELSSQFLFESVFLSLVSVVTALILVESFLPIFNNMANKQLDISYFGNWYTVPFLLFIVFFVGGFAGSYPAAVLSSFKPVNVLKGQLTTGTRKSRVRSALVILQFSISIFLIISTLIVNNQLQYMKNKNLGFNKDSLVTIKRANVLRNHEEAFKTSLLQNPDIIDATFSNAVPGELVTSTAVMPEDDPENVVLLSSFIVDHDYQSTMKIELAEGRFFSRDNPDDYSTILINEKTVETLGWENPVGRQLQIFVPPPGKPITLTIIGVVKDFHYETLRREIKDLGIMLKSYDEPLFNFNYLTVRINSEGVRTALAHIEVTWERMLPDQPIQFSFLDRSMSSLYVGEEVTGRLFISFSLLSIFIACLGLIGLAAYAAEQRTKEIGIRKTLGSSVGSVVYLFLKEFSFWIITANVIAWPAAWFVMDRWLSNFAYRIDIGLTVFIFSGIIALVLSMSTVLFHAVKAANVNPVDSLKYE